MSRSLPLLAALLVAACSQAPVLPEAPAPATAAAAAPEPVESLAPVVLHEQARNIAFFDSEGKQHRLAEYKGKFVLLTFFAHWCGVCQKELPVLQQFAKETADKGAVVVPVEADGSSRDLVAAFSSKYGIDIPLFNDPSRNAPNTYGVKNFPTVYIISPDFVAQENIVGRASIEFYRQRQGQYQKANWGLLSGRTM